MPHHEKLERWIRECKELCAPDAVVWIDGSEAQREALTEEACGTGELRRLDPEKHPGCVYHRTHPSDVARTEGCTYICSRNVDDAPSRNHWKDPKEAYEEAAGFFRGSMQGRTMYVIPFSMGPVGSRFSKIGVELTDSIYVVLNMLIMTRVGTAVREALGTDGEFTRCLHGKGDRDPKKRRVLHFPEDNTIWSVNSGYGGNVLLGKKCLALRIASYMARRDPEPWMAEHMLIMGVEHPDGRVDYIAGAFPSACGKTNLAMLVPPEALRRRGYKVWTVGDDIAWMRLDREGRLRAINPETGFFGVAPGTNTRTNPNAIKTVAENSIFTNTVVGADGTVWWEGGDGTPPADALDWVGEPWSLDTTGPRSRPGETADGVHRVYGSHPNARFTAPVSQCPSKSAHWDDPEGVPITAVIFGSRRARLTPLVIEALSWPHGVYLAANMTSERTAAQAGIVGELRRDPMAMRPFFGYNMADYFQHWLYMGRRFAHPPRIFRVNWFRRDDAGNFIWPGFGENLRVLLWMLARCRGEADASQTPLGYVPTYESIDWAGLDFPRDAFDELHRVEAEDWLEEDDINEQFLRQFGPRLPIELWDEHWARQRRLHGEE